MRGTIWLEQARLVFLPPKIISKLDDLEQKFEIQHSRMNFNGKHKRYHFDKRYYETNIIFSFFSVNIKES